MWKVRNYIDLNLATYLYKTLIHPLYTYCDFLYDGCSISNKSKLQISQNAALRAVNKSPYDYPTVRLHNDLEIDNLATAHQKSTLKIVFRAQSNTGPQNLNNMFTIYQPTQQLRSANEKLILPPKTRTKFAEYDIAYRGCQYWNPMPIEGKLIETLDQFKKYLKTYGNACLLWTWFWLTHHPQLLHTITILRPSCSSPATSSSIVSPFPCFCYLHCIFICTRGRRRCHYCVTATPMFRVKIKLIIIIIIRWNTVEPRQALTVMPTFPSINI